MGKLKNLLGTELLNAANKAIQNIEQEAIAEVQVSLHEQRREEMHLLSRQSKVFVDNICDSVKEGWLNALEAQVVFNQMKKELERGLKKNEDAAIEESSKHSKSYEYQGYNITNVDGRRSFDYSRCLDVVAKRKELKELEEMHKKARISADSGGYSEVKTLPDGETIQVWFDANGEELALPTIKYSKSYIKIERK